MQTSLDVLCPFENVSAEFQRDHMWFGKGHSSVLLPAWGNQKEGAGHKTQFSQELQLCQARRQGSAKSYSCARLPGPTNTDWPVTEGSGNSLQWMYFHKLSIAVTIFPYVWTTTFCFLWKLMMKQTLGFFWGIALASLGISKWLNHLAEKNRLRHSLACHYFDFFTIQLLITVPHLGKDTDLSFLGS